MKTNIKNPKSKKFTFIASVFLSIMLVASFLLGNANAETSFTDHIVVRIYKEDPFAEITNLSDGENIIFDNFTLEYEYRSATSATFSLMRVLEDNVNLICEWTDVNEDFDPDKVNFVQNSKELTLNEFGDYIIYYRAAGYAGKPDYEDSISFKHYSTKVDYIETNANNEPVFDIYYNTKSNKIEFNIYNSAGKLLFNPDFIHEDTSDARYKIIEKDDSASASGVMRIRVVIPMPESATGGEYTIKANGLDAEGNYLGPNSTDSFLYEPLAPDVPDTGENTSRFDIANSDYLITSLLAFFAISVFVLIYINRRHSEK